MKKRFKFWKFILEFNTYPDTINSKPVDSSDYIQLCKYWYNTNFRITL